MSSSNETILKAMIALLIVVICISIYSSVFASSIIGKNYTLGLENYIVNNAFMK